MQCSCKSPLFYFLSDAELELIQKNKISVLFKKGETIRKQGTFMTHVISVNSGLAKVYLEGVNDTTTIIRIVKPTNFIGGPGMYLDQIHHYTLSAITDTMVCFINLQVFKEIIDTNKRFAQEFLRDFSLNVLSVYNRLVYLTNKQMPGRMADTLIYLFDEIFQSSKFNLYLSKQDFADLSGMSKESAIKVLRDFQNNGIIRILDDEMELLDPEALNRISKIG
jgi:CRP/FNR family transcriptional regulator